MHVDFREFLYRFAGTVAMTLLPVVLVAFVSMPLSLNRHPGDTARNGNAVPSHMT